MIPASLRDLGYAAAVLLFAVAGLGAPANAQQPTQAQANAIRSACPSDFRANCSGVQPGGAAALACLQQNMAKLSPACQSAVGAVSGAATAPAPSTAPAAPPAATTTAPAAAPDTTAAPAPTAAPPPAATTTVPPAVKPAKPTQAQQNAIRSACQSDFRANCAGVQPGGSAALACLQQNVASLSAPCQKAVGALSGGAAAAPAGTPPAAAKPAAVAAPPVALTPRQEIRIVRESCGPDFRRLCGTVPLGGGRAIACLRANAASLSPPCQDALMGR